MKNTFTVMDIIDGRFVATVYDSTNNQEIYKTSPRTTQLQATQDVNTFLTSKASGPTPTRTTIQNTTTFKPGLPVNTPTPRRCCGR